MKDGEVEEDQGGCGLVLGLFYANALAPFPLPSPRWPTFRRAGPVSTSKADKSRQFYQNLRQ